MTDWERFEADIFPGRAWRLDGATGPIEVVEYPDDDIFIVLQPPDPTWQERVRNAIRSRLPLIEAERQVTASGLPFETEEAAKQFGTLLAAQQDVEQAAEAK